MKVRTFIAAAGAAALLGCTAAVVIPATASAAPASRTLTFTSVATNGVTFSRASRGRQDTDVNRAGKTVGFDMLNVTVNPSTGQGTILFTVDARGGFLIGYLPYTTSRTLRGYVTGGVGAYKDAFGPVVARELGKARNRYFVTITYST